MFNLEHSTSKHNEEHNKKWTYIPEHPYRMLTVGGSESGKTNPLLNLIKKQDVSFVCKKFKWTKVQIFD